MTSVECPNITRDKFSKKCLKIDRALLDFIILAFGSCVNAQENRHLALPVANYVGIHEEYVGFSNSSGLEFTIDSIRRLEVVLDKMTVFNHPRLAFMKRRIDAMLNLNKKVSLASFSGAFIVEKSLQVVSEAKK